MVIIKGLLLLKKLLTTKRNYPVFFSPLKKLHPNQWKQAATRMNCTLMYVQAEIINLAGYDHEVLACINYLIYMTEYY